MYAPIGSFLGPCDTRISTRSPSFFPPPSWRKGKGEGAVVGVTRISHAKLRNAERAWSDPVRRPCLRDMGGLRSKRSVRSGAGALHSGDWPGSRWNANERRHARPYRIYALSCPVRTPSGVSSGCTRRDSDGTVPACRALFLSVGERSYADPFVGLGSSLHSLVWSRQRGDDRSGLLRGHLPSYFQHLDRCAVGQSSLDSLRRGDGRRRKGALS